jgi:hypothetical protein
VIYHGLFGGGFFQRLYAPGPSSALMFCTALEYHVLITGPLLVLSLSFPVLLPLAVTSLLTSVAVCVVAGAQASLPPRKTRFWSRPLVALLFLLQPVVRGLARYQASLTARSAVRPKARRTSPAPSPVGREPAALRTYWTQGGATRYDFLRALFSRLELEGWQLRPDTGWTGHDIEIMGSRWSRVRLTTVTEELDQGRRNFRCRLVPHWSLLAKVFLGAVFGAELVVVGFLAHLQPWVWMLPLTIWLPYWLLQHEQWVLIEPIALLVDDVAATLGLVKVEHKEEVKT